ncbi:MAG: response regulator transcription factor [Acidobacteria bacterium]|nr:response regulator transcription factor [Acidobacteriota bacterium]
MRLLVVEDEPDLAATLRKSLVEEGFAVDVVSDGQEALWQAESVAYDVVVLDLMLPRLSGVEVLQRLRVAGSRVPVLVLTARDGSADKISALNTGADDYLTKPFTFAELLARIRALIRRAAGVPSPVVRLGPISIETSARRVTRDGIDIELSPKEFALLEFLALHRGKLVTRSMLYEHIYDDEDATMSNVVDVYVASLRRKLGRDVIRTRRGAGYIIDA